MTRRLIAGLLTLCMLVSLCPPNAFALRSSAAVVPETESTVVEPAAEEPEVEEPAVEEPKAEEPAAEEPVVEEPQTEDTPAEDTPAEDPAAEDPQTEDPQTEEPAAEDPQTEDPAVEEPKAEEETPKYATVNVNGSVKLTASAEDGGKWASDNIAAATVGAEKADAGEKNVAEVFGVAEGSTTVTYTVGDEKEVWKITVTAAPAEETPAEEEPADVTYSVSRYLEEKAPEGSEVPFTYTQIDTISVTGKPGAEVTLPAVDGAVAVNTDAEDVLPNDDGTATLTLPAETPEEHSLSVFYVKAEARPDISEMDIVNPATKIDTYKFVVDGVTVSTQKVKAGETVYAPASPEKEGYKFTGWFRDGVEFDPTKLPAVGDKEYTYTAQFEEVYYVYFMDNQGRVKVTKEYTNGQYIVTSDVSFPIGSNEGIDGWSLTNIKEQQSDVGDKLTVTKEDITLYPIVVKGFWITYNTDGGTIMEPDFFYESQTPAAPDDPEKPGYQFGGWTLKGEKYSFGSALSANITLDAVWTPKTDTPYTIIYWSENADDDGYCYESQRTATGTTGETVTLSADNQSTSNIKSDNGDYFKFKEYDTGKTIAGDGSTIINVYFARNVYTFTFQVYQRWKGYVTIHTFSAKYGADISDEWSFTGTDGVNYPLTDEVTSWKPSGSKTYTQRITRMERMPAENITFRHTTTDYEERTFYYYTETLSGQTGSKSYNNKSFNLYLELRHDFNDTYYNDDFFILEGFDRYAITTGDNDSKLSKNPGSHWDSHSRTNFYYTRKSYNLQYYNVNTTAKTASVQYQAPLTGYYDYTPERPDGVDPNYVFQGWYTSPACEAGTEAATKLTTMPAGDRVVYAKWAAPEKTAEVHVDIALGSDSKTLTVLYGQKINPEDLKGIEAPKGSTWDGSWVEYNGKSFVPFDINTTITRNVVLYPNFISTDKCTVTYDANGGTGTVTDTKAYNRGAIAGVLHGTSLEAPEGKVFLGWALSKDATAPDYKPGDKFQIMGDTTLYAVWGAKAALATLTYHPNGGKGTATTENPLNNESVTLKSNTELGFTRTGYKFLGWSTNSTATEAEYLANAAIIVDNKSPNTLYAVWELNEFPYTIKYYHDSIGEANYINKYDGAATQVGTEVTIGVDLLNEELPDGYVAKTAEEKITITANAANNVLNVVYTKRTDLSYTVNYLEKGTTNVLATAKTQGDQTFGTEITSADEVISINGYNFDSADKEKLTIGTGENVINLYYTKRTDLSYTVNYYWMGTTTKIADSKTVDKQTFDAKVTESAIDVAGYTKADPTEKTITIAVEGNEINFYYYKNVTVTADNKSKTYGSDDPELTATVSGTLGSDTVTYTVSRAEGENVGTYDITPSGDEIQGNYKVSYEEGVFTITAQSINPVGPDPEKPDPNYTGATVDSPADHVYDGAAHKFVPVVKNGDGVVMTEGTDYEVNYSTTDFTNVTGTITVTITGKGNYTGTVTRTYEITPAPYTVTTESASKVFDGIALTAGGKVEGIVTGETYTLTMTGSQTIQGSSSNTYELTWGTAKQSNYELKSETIGTLTVTKQSINPTEPDTEKPDPNYLGVTVGDLGDLVYNGLSQEQEPVVKDKNKVDLVKGTDYTLSWTSATNVGTVTVTVTGIGNYTGTVTRTYEITPAPYTVTTYSAIKVYDGHPLTAGGQVDGLVNGETCTVNTTASRTEYGTTENKPYTLTWGTANKNNYEFKGETIGTLTVVRQSINPTDPPIPTDPDGEKPIDPDRPYYGGVTVEDPADVMYDGKSHKGLPVVKDAEGNTLELDKDYTLSYSDDTVNVGTVTVTITGIGNYQGVFIHLEGNGDGLYTRPVTYQITPRHVTLTSEGGTKPYDGTPLTKPGVAVGGDGFVAGEVSGLKATGTVTNVTETPVINTITYTTGADFKATNYIIEKAEGELSITKAEVGVVTVSGLRDTYWWTGAEREVTGFIHDGEDRLITVTIKDKDKAVARGTEVGRYYMGLKETDFTAESPNYYKVVVKVEDGYLDIVPINITVTVTVRGNRDTVTYDGNPHTVEGYEVVSAIANTGRDMGMDGITLKFKGDASVTGTEVGTYDMGLSADDFTVTCDIYRVVRVVVEDGGLEITPAPEEITEPTEEIPDETVPLAPPEEIPDEPVPQAGPAWALVNLILSILTVLASLLLLVGYFGKKEEEAEDENGNAILDAEGNNVMNDIKKRGGWRLASLVPAILSVIAFLLTENMRNPMILVDRWTLLMVIIAVVQVLVMLLSKKKTEDNTQEA